MALPEAPQPQTQPSQGASQGGMLVTTPMGPQSQRSTQQRPQLSDATLAEQKAGKEASTKANTRTADEQEAGRKIAERLAAGGPQQLRPQRQQ